MKFRNILEEKTELNEGVLSDSFKFTVKEIGRFLDVDPTILKVLKTPLKILFLPLTTVFSAAGLKIMSKNLVDIVKKNAKNNEISEKEADEVLQTFALKLLEKAAHRTQAINTGITQDDIMKRIEKEQRTEWDMIKIISKDFYKQLKIAGIKLI